MECGRPAEVVLHLTSPSDGLCVAGTCFFAGMSSGRPTLRVRGVTLCDANGIEAEALSGKFDEPDSDAEGYGGDCGNL